MIELIVSEKPDQFILTTNEPWYRPDHGLGQGPLSFSYFISTLPNERFILLTYYLKNKTYNNRQKNTLNFLVSYKRKAFP